MRSFPHARFPLSLRRLSRSARKCTTYPPTLNTGKAMHISVTTLKRLCRRHGVRRWPHRQISGINRALADLEAQHDAAGRGEDVSAVKDELRQLHRRREAIIEVRVKGVCGGEGARGACCLIT